MRGRLPLTALAFVALIVAGCGSKEPAEGGGAATRDAAFAKGVKFAGCMRENGVGDFPDPDGSGSMTIDGVLNGSSLDPSAPAWKQAMAACRSLQPPGFTGDKEVSPEQQDARLEFARCMRENGVEDFPDPAEGEPLVNTNLIPSAARPGGMTVINAGMRKCGDLVAEAAGGRR